MDAKEKYWPSKGRNTNNVKLKTQNELRNKMERTHHLI